MRYPVEQKAETHERIIDAATRSLREHGSEGQGVARLMKDVGLTHGGFYRHFESKEDLYVDAIARGFQEAADRMLAAAARAPQGEQLRAIIERYLSLEHLEDSGGGCVLSTLAAEIARQRPAVRARINAAMKCVRIAFNRIDFGLRAVLDSWWTQQEAPASGRARDAGLAPVCSAEPSSRCCHIHTGQR